MSTLKLFTLGFLIGMLIFSFLMLYRNHCVGNFRLRILDDKTLSTHEQLEEYDKYPPYFEMLNKFWIWDFRKFRRED